MTGTEAISVEYWEADRRVFHAWSNTRGWSGNIVRVERVGGPRTCTLAQLVNSSDQRLMEQADDPRTLNAVSGSHPPSRFWAMEPGSWTELFVGFLNVLVVSGFGYLAWKEAKEAAGWARRATELQAQANALAEAELPVRLRARIEHDIYHDGDEQGQPFDAWIVIEAAEGCAAVFIHGAVTAGAHLPSPRRESIDFGEVFGKFDIEPADRTEWPKRLRPGESIPFHNPWSSYSPTLAAGAWAKIAVSFSVTGEPPVSDVEIPVVLPMVNT